MTDSADAATPSATSSQSDWIAAQLRAAFDPSELVVEDDSARHAGHAGAAEGSHFNVTIVSDRFSSKSRVARHRLVYDALADALPKVGTASQASPAAPSGRRGIHALAIAAFTPDEFATRTN